MVIERVSRSLDFEVKIFFFRSDRNNRTLMYYNTLITQIHANEIFRLSNQRVIE